jgi:uncharacterized protein
MPSAPTSDKLRVVLDTNVFYSAFTHSQGVPFRIWRKAVEREYTLLTSPAILREVAKVFRQDLQWQEVAIVSHLKLIARVAQIIIPRIAWHVITQDEADNRILECAVEGQADLIVSGDHHLRQLKSFRGVGIIRPIDFYRTLGL